MELTDKVAVITGGASGIGAACCRAFAAEGALVAVVDRNEDGARAVAEEIKGVAVALADGISSSRVGGVARSVAVRNFLDDYYCTPDTWSVQGAASRVIAAINAWLHAETRRGEGAEDRRARCEDAGLAEQE